MPYMIAVSLEMSDEPKFVPLPCLVTIYACFELQH